MRDGIKTRTSILAPAVSGVPALLCKHLIYALAGFISTRGTVLGKLLPFGISLVGGVDIPYIASAALGSVVGYFTVQLPYSSFRYLASAVALAAIRLLIGTTFKSANKPAVWGFVSAALLLLTGLAAENAIDASMVTIVAEALIAGSGAYFTAKAAGVLSEQTAVIKTEELASIIISAALLLAGFYGITIGGLSLGRILAAALILLAARYGGISTGSVCGVALGFSAVLCGNDGAAAVLMSTGGLISGVFARLGKYAQIAAFAIAAFVSISVSGTITSVLYIIESLLGSVLFLLVPKSVALRACRLFSPAAETEAPTGLKKAVMMRLNFAANALCDVSQTVEQVSKELAKINAPDFGGVLRGVERDACKGCSLRIHCWEAKKGDTVAAVLDMTKAVKNGEYSPEVLAPEEFKGRCLRPARMGSAVYKHYSDYASKISAENRIEEVRSVVSDQFDGISSMLRDLSEELEKGETFDNAAAEAVVSALKNIDIRVSECCCKVDKYGRMYIEMRIKNAKDLVVNRMHIMQQASLACDRDFGAPVINKLSDETLITMSERCVLDADIGINQIPCSASSMCGDAYQYFYDGKGRLVMILSDGMGSGGRAAVDGAMASGLMSRLLKAGFGYDCSLRILNSSMLFKSTDESLATVDIAVIDLFTGRTDLLKAGAAPTLVRRSGRTGKAQSSSLPAGILRDIGFDKATIRLKKGDILLLLSDGATAEGTEWICAELECWRDGTAQELSEHISECARRRRKDNHEDDITVMAAILKKAM